MKITSSTSKFRQQSAFTLMEILVVIAIIILIAAIALPVLGRAKKNANKALALKMMGNLASAAANFAGQNDGRLPDEDGAGKEDWNNIGTPEQAKAWYNALPTMMGSKSPADFVKEGRTAAYYTKESILYLPGAQYPESKKMQKPLFAVAINGKLQRKDKDDKKNEVRLQGLANASRTVLFLEQGLPGEDRAHETISKKDYDGAPKGNAKSFVARYTGKGVIAFLDGGAREVAGKDLLDSTGKIIWAPDADINQSVILWTTDPKSDPNGKAGGGGTPAPTK